MTERPILYNATMVIANRTDIKTQTRRTAGLAKINADPDSWYLANDEPVKDGRFMFGYHPHTGYDLVRCPYGVEGDWLWTREAWRARAIEGDSKPSIIEPGSPVSYEADDPKPYRFGKLRPSIFMPRWASRDTLEVISVRPERLHSITDKDCFDEGIQSAIDHNEAGAGIGGDTSVRACYQHLWNSTNGKKFSWPMNPWVWRIEYRRISR